MAFRNYREGTKANWGKTDHSVKNPTEVSLTLEQINTGCFLRIADAMDKMAVNHVKLQNDYDYMRKSRDSYQLECERLRNSVRTMKGVITKLKKKQCK